MNHRYNYDSTWRLQVQFGRDRFICRFVRYWTNRHDCRPFGLHKNFWRQYAPAHIWLVRGRILVWLHSIWVHFLRNDTFRPSSIRYHFCMRSCLLFDSVLHFRPIHSCNTKNKVNIVMKHLKSVCRNRCCETTLDHCFQIKRWLNLSVETGFII